MRFALAAAASIALALPATAQTLDVPSGTYVNDPAHTSITWKVSHLGYSNYTGMFARDAVDATIALDAEDVANSSLDVTIDGQEVRTLHPGSEDFDAEIASDQFLNTAQSPEIRFTTTGIEVTGENTATITGDLTIADETHPFTLDATLNKAAPNPVTGQPVLGITATGTLMRSQYGVDGLLGPISDEVSVEIQAEFMQEG